MLVFVYRRCEVCRETVFKYRCPRCLMKTCSLSCVKQHKLTSGCDGQRDTTAFVSLDDFTDLNLLSGSFEQFLCILFHCHVIQYSLTLAFSWKGIESQAASKLLLAGRLLHTKVVLFLNFCLRRHCSNTCLWLTCVIQCRLQISGGCGKTHVTSNGRTR